MNVDVKLNGKVVEIGGESYLIEYWKVEKSLEIFAWLTKNFGESFMAFFMGEGDAPEVMEELGDGSTTESATKIDKVLKQAIANLNPKEYVTYAKIILKDVQHGAKPINLDKVFRGRMLDLHTLLFHVLTYQYSDFLGGGIDE